jgi:ribokinase
VSTAVPGIVGVVGSVNLDLVLRSRRLPERGETIADATIFEGLGGKGANQALAAARMGASVWLVACVGGDPAGAAALQTLRAGGVDTSACRVVSEPTGRAAVLVDDDGRNVISVGPGANGLLAPQDVGAAWPDGTTIMLTQLEIPPASVSAAISQAGRRGVSACLNVTPADRFAAVTQRPDMLVANRSEAELLSGETGTAGQLAARLGDRLGIDTVVVTDGRRGAAARRGPELLVARAPEVEVRDTTGAGDAFAGALAASLAEGVALNIALGRACVAGALACTVVGAALALPFREDVLAACVTEALDGSG